MSRPSRVPAAQHERRLDTAPADWVGPPPESEGAPYYFATLRANIWLIVITTAVCVAVAYVFITITPKVYESDADLLITPIARENQSLAGLGLPTDSSDATRDIETVVRLIETQAVARRVIRTLRLDETPSELLKKVSASPVASSNVVTVTASGDTPQVAARIANTFARASVADRTQRLHNQLDVVIPRLRKQIAAVGPNDQAARPALLQKLRDLEVARTLDDPTIRLATTAEPNASPVSPRPALSIAAAMLAGLLLGAGVVLASQLLDPRLRREEQLRRYRIPILARVPLERGRKRKGGAPMLPAAMSAAAHDAYLLLGATLSVRAADGGEKRSVLVTGPNSGDGKSTSALNLATAISGGESVVLIEADSRRPSLARVLGARPLYGITSVLSRKTHVGNALVPAGLPAADVQLLVQVPSEPSLSTVLTPTSAGWLLGEVHRLTNWAVIDAPPLALVPDALPLAKEVDDVILVVRLGTTRLKALEELAGLLVQQGLTPTGFVLIGGRRQTAYY